MNYHHLARRRMGPAAFHSAVLYPIQLAWLPVSVASSPSQLSKPQLPPPIQTLHFSVLAVSAPRRCLSYILLRCSGPRWPPYQLPGIPHSMSPFPHGPSLNVCTPPSRFTKCIRRPFGPTKHSSDANTPLPTPGPIYRVRMRQLRQRQKEKEG